MPFPRQAEPPIWICRSCQKLMRVRTIELVNDEEQTKLVCAACGSEATQTRMLSTSLPA
jgi:DNA-directed RNA polymerase subunit M/transcription elongation factor TFIIS